MTALLLIVLFAWIASAVGQTLCLMARWFVYRPLERFVYGCALGLGIAAYGIFAIGMCGILTPVVMGAWWMVLAAFGWRGMRTQFFDLMEWMRSLRAGELRGRLSTGSRWVVRCSSAILLVSLFIGILMCYQPPGALEWDALSYHLAAPKVYLQQHRITLLPTQHQTNFPFTIEMLFTSGLAFGGTALANLFHLLFACLTALAIIMYGERNHGSGSGFLGALIFVTTPLVIWEASVAYIDIGFALYVTLAAFAVLAAIRPLRHSGSDSTSRLHEGDSVDQQYVWLSVAAIMIGFALGAKYLAMVPLAVLACLLALRRLPLKSIVRFVLVAVVIGSPWYIKSAVLMHNPVYPYAYQLFPHSRYWNHARDIPYRSEQEKFGTPHSLSDPRASLINLLDTPWTLVANANLYFNPGEYTFSAMIGGLYAAFCLALLVARPIRPEEGDLLFIGGAQFVAWFFVAQVGRYLIPVLPIFALIGGIGARAMLFPERRRQSIGTSALQLATIGLLMGQTILFLCSVTLVPKEGSDARDFAQRTGLPPTALSLAGAFNLAADVAVQRQEVSQHLDDYDALQWLNLHTKPNEGVILFEDTKGYYLDRPYLWGNDQHSSYIPYESLPDGEGITSWMNQHGYGYAVIDLNWSPDNATHAPIPTDEEAEARIDEWYAHPKTPPAIGSWRRTVGDAIGKGLWKVVYISHGNVVFRIGNAGDDHIGSVNTRRLWRNG